MKKYDIHPDFNPVSFRLPFNRLTMTCSRIPLKIMFAAAKLPSGVFEKRIDICSDSKTLPLYVFQPKTSSEKMPCLLYFHGGGFGYKAAAYHKTLAGIYAKEVGCKVIFPDYRLLPKNPYPAAKNDALNALDFVFQNAKLLGIDKSKIAVGGDSAGGALAFYAAYCGKTEVSPILCLLVYPVVGTDTETQSLKEIVSTPLWNSVNNRNMWELYLGKNESVKNEAMPMLAKIERSVPAYIETAEFDCLHDEDVLLAQRLKENGIAVRLSETKGTIHGYDLAMNSKITKQSVEKRISVLKEAFG